MLFVCTANVARSAYAEFRMRQLLGPVASVLVGGAGVPGYPGRPMDAGMLEVLAAHGLDGGGHVSRSLDTRLASESDLILTMEYRHHAAILDSWPEAAVKCFGLGQFADAVDCRAAAVQADGVGRRFAVTDLVFEMAGHALPDSMTWDVADPHGRAAPAYRRCAARIDADLKRMLPWFATIGTTKTPDQ